MLPLFDLDLFNKDKNSHVFLLTGYAILYGGFVYFFPFFHVFSFGKLEFQTFFYLNIYFYFEP